MVKVCAFAGTFCGSYLVNTNPFPKISHKKQVNSISLVISFLPCLHKMTEVQPIPVSTLGTVKAEPYQPKKGSLKRIPASAGADVLLKAMDEDGGVIMTGFLNSSQLNQINKELDPVLESKHVGSTRSNDFTQDFHGSKTRRVTNLMSHSPTFAHEVLDNDLLYAICDRVFLKDSGDYWLNTAAVIEVGPGSEPQMLHREQQQYEVFHRFGLAAPVCELQFFLALTPFTDENGATRVIPGSHLWEDMEYVGTQGDTIPAEMDAGDVCFFGSRTVHGSGANRTKNEWRRGCGINIHVSYLTPEEAYPFQMSVEDAKKFSPRLQKMMGFRSQYPKGSPGLWQIDYNQLADAIGLDD